MSGSPDSSNLMYVTKAYEEEVKNKAKRIYANDEVALSMENLNIQLNNIVKEIDEKLGFVTNKIEGEYGVDDYVRAVHTQIDKVDIDQSDLVDDSIKDTKTHPSVMAFKSGRTDTKFNLYDFINKSVEFNNKSTTLAMHGSKVIDPNEAMLTFNFNATAQEYLKIIEFSFTYKQYPDIVTVDIDDTISKETTVTVTRIISGRFFLIRHDPINKPTEFIIKAIINNSDNTGNILDRKFIDVQAYKDSGDFSYIFDDGPQFDLYFTFDGNTSDGLKIHIGKVLPYRYVIRKNYINSNDGTLDTNFKKIDTTIGATTNIGTHNIEDIYHSNNLACSFIVDKTKNEISIINDGDKFDNRRLSDISDIGHTSGSTIQEFWVKDVGDKTFIRLKDNEHDTCYVGINSVTRVQDLGRPVLDVLGTSTGEILVRLGNVYYFFDNDTNQISTTMFNAAATSGISTFKQSSIMVEYLDKYLIQFYTKSDGVYYCVKELDTERNKYSTVVSVSPEHKISVFPDARIEDLVPTNSEIMGFSDMSGIYLGLNYRNDSNGNVSFIIHLSSLSVVGISYVFSTSNLLSVFNKSNSATSNLAYKIKKFVKTRLFNFLITDTEQLYIFDESRIVKAITFEEVPDKGWTDKNSVIYMKPDKNQEEYYLVNNAYLQNVLDVIDTPNGIVISDRKGIYILEESKNLVCKLYMDEDAQVIKYLPSMDMYGRFGGVITVENPSDTILKYGIYKNDYLLKEYSGNKLRYEYIDLFTSDYQLYDSDVEEYDTETPIIDFHAILYISFVDHLSILYNNTGTYNIHTSNGLTYGQLNDPTYIGKKYTISTNKYGFIKYDNILDIDTSKSRISDINSIKKFKIIHRPNDSFTYQDAIDTIHAMIQKEYEKYKNDLVYVKGSKKYKANTNEDEALNNIKYRENNKLYNFVDTSYGRYGLQEAVGGGSGDTYGDLYWQSNTRLPIDRNSLQLNVEKKYIDLAPDITFSINDKFNIVETNDVPGTIYLSNGSKVIESQAFPDGKFIIPFTTESIDGGGTRGIKKAIKIDGDSGSVYFTNITKASDGEIIAWNNEFGDVNYNFANKNIYRRTIYGTFEAIPVLINPFNVENTVYDTKIENVIKINDVYHIFGIKRIVTDGSTTYQLVYAKISSESKTLINATNSLIPNCQELFTSVLPKLDVYDFTNDKFIVVNFDKNVYICKYDKEKDQFATIIYPTTKRNALFDNEYEVMLTEVEVDENIYEIYGSGAITKIDVNKQEYTDQFYPMLFRLDTTNDYLETILPMIKYERTDIRKVRWFYYDKFEKTINICDDEHEFKYFIKSKEIKTFDVDERFVTTETDYRPYSTSKVMKFVSSVPGEEDRYIGKVFSLTKHFDGEKDNLYLCEYKENTVPREIYKIGNNNKLSSYIVKPSVAKTYDSNKTYYKLDIGKTIFNKYISANFPTNGLEKTIKIFKCEPRTNNRGYVLVDNSIVKTPLIDFDYYKQDRTTGMMNKTLDKVFNPIYEYYTDNHNYRLVDLTKVNDPDSEENRFDTNAKYFTSINPKFIECVDSDFNIDPSTHLKTFKDDEIYYEMDEIPIVVDIDETNTRIIDNRLVVNAEFKTPDDQPSIFDKNYLVYNLTDPELFVHSDYRHKLLEHATIFGLDSDSIFKIWDTKFGKFGLLYKTDANGINSFVFVKTSNDYSIVEKIYDGLGSNGVINTRKSIQLPTTIFDSNTPNEIDNFIMVYETTNNLFVTLRYRENSQYNHKTFVINSEDFEATMCNEGHDYTHIVEFEDGKIYGCDETVTETNGEITKMKFYLYGANGTNAFSETPSIECNIGEGFRYLKSIKHINSEGRIELFIFGIGSLHNIYRLYDGVLEPYDDPLFQSLIEDNNFTIINNYYVNFTSHISYNIITKELMYFWDFSRPLSNHSPDDITLIEDGSYENINETVLIINPSINKFYGINEDNIIDNDYDRCMIFKLISVIEDPLKLKNKNYENENYIIEEMGQSLQNKLPMLTQLPILSKEDELYYQCAKARTDNLLPNYENKYDAYEKDYSGTIKHKNCSFDKIILTSIGMFGIIKNTNGTFEIYLDETYSNSNGFTHIRDLQAWTEVPKAMPNIQECDGEIYLTFRDIYKFDKINHTFSDENKVLSFGNSVVYTNCTEYTDDKYEVQDELFTKLFITKTNDMYYYVKVDGVYTAYKYNKETKMFEMWFSEDSSRGILLGEMISIRDISIGVILITDDGTGDYSHKNLVNLTRKEIMPKPPAVINISNNSILNGSMTMMCDIAEFGEKRTILLLTLYESWDSNKIFEYNFDTSEWKYIPNLFSDEFSYKNATKFIHEIIVDNEDDIHDVLILAIKNDDGTSPYRIAQGGSQTDPMYNTLSLNIIKWDYTNNCLINGIVPIGSAGPNTTGSYVDSSIGKVPIYFMKNSNEPRIIIPGIQTTDNENGHYFDIKFRFDYENNIVKTINNELLDFNNDYQDLYGIMEYNGVYIARNKDSISMFGFNIKEVEKDDEETKYKQIGYMYSVIGENKKKWNNELEDISNTLRDKYLLKVLGICKENEFSESFIDNNNDYFSEIDAEHAKSMDLVEFYKKYYLTNWEKNKENHMFKKREDIINDMYISSSNTLDDTHIFDDETFEIELNIFGSPVVTTDENEIDSMRLSTSWYLKRLNKHKPHLPYYPFNDA